MATATNITHTGSFTPTEKGSYARVNNGVAVCSPCCGNTFVAPPEQVKSFGPLTTEPLTCPACDASFKIVADEIVNVPKAKTRAKSDVTGS